MESIETHEEFCSERFFVGRTQRGSYSDPRRRVSASERLLERPFLESLLKILLRTFPSSKTHYKTSSKNLSQIESSLEIL